jgi:hypothetical protein
VAGEPVVQAGEASPGAGLGERAGRAGKPGVAGKRVAQAEEASPGEGSAGRPGEREPGRVAGSQEGGPGSREWRVGANETRHSRPGDEQQPTYGRGRIPRAGHERADGRPDRGSSGLTEQLTTPRPKAAVTRLGSMTATRVGAAPPASRLKRAAPAPRSPLSPGRAAFPAK